jgi:hypothetical protein
VKDVKGNVVSLCFGRQQSKADETWNHIFA